MYKSGTHQQIKRKTGQRFVLDVADEHLGHMKLLGAPIEIVSSTIGSHSSHVTFEATEPIALCVCELFPDTDFAVYRSEVAEYLQFRHRLVTDQHRENPNQ